MWEESDNEEHDVDLVSPRDLPAASAQGSASHANRVLSTGTRSAAAAVGGGGGGTAAGGGGGEDDNDDMSSEYALRQARTNQLARRKSIAVRFV